MGYALQSGWSPLQLERSRQHLANCWIMVPYVYCGAFGEKGTIRALKTKNDHRMISYVSSLIHQADKSLFGSWWSFGGYVYIMKCILYNITIRGYRTRKHFLVPVKCGYQYARNFSKWHNLVSPLCHSWRLPWIWAISCLTIFVIWRIASTLACPPYNGGFSSSCSQVLGIFSSRLPYAMSCFLSWTCIRFMFISRYLCITLIQAYKLFAIPAYELWDSSL